MSKKSTHNFRGLIADTAEMPAIKSVPKQPVRKVRPKRRSEGPKRPVLMAIVAIVGSFLLGLAIRMAVNIPSIISELTPVVPGLRSIASPQPVDPGVDIIAELGKKVEAPLYIDQVLPFRMQNGSPRLTALGGYLLTSNGEVDKKRPVMAVFATNDLGATVSVGSTVLVSGYVVMANGSEQTAASVLNADQESDLIYIIARVNFWDRVTILGAGVRSYNTL